MTQSNVQFLITAEMKAIFASAMLKLRAVVNTGMNAAAMAGGDVIKTGMQERINTGPRSGRTYARAGGRIHQASAPGEPPARDYGPLSDTMQTVIARQGVDEVVVHIGSGMDYAEELELRGTDMDGPRPFMRVTADEKETEVLQAAAEELKARILAVRI